MVGSMFFFFVTKVVENETETDQIEQTSYLLCGGVVVKVCLVLKSNLLESCLQLLQPGVYLDCDCMNGFFALIAARENGQNKTPSLW